MSYVQVAAGRFYLQDSIYSLDIVKEISYITPVHIQLVARLLAIASRLQQCDQSYF